MKKYLNAIIVLIAFHSINVISQDDVEEIVVTSAFIDTSEINNPLYVIDGSEFSDGATTSLGDAIDEYLGVSIADYGAAVGQPIIRGMSGPRVKILKNGVVNRDVSGLGVDHLNDVDLNDISQVEIVKGPSSLLYANGTIGGIINVVDDLISSKNFELPEVAVGYESQSVNDGNSEFVNLKGNVGGFNVNFGYKNTDFGNYDVPSGAVIHSEEEHHDEEEHDEEEEHEEHAPTVFMNEAVEYGATFDISNDSSTQKVVVNFVDEDNSIVGEEAFMNPANSKEFTIGYYLSKDLGIYDLDVGFRLDQIERSGSVTEEEHGDHHDDDHGDDHGDEHGEVDYYNIDDSTNSFAVTLGRSLNDNLGVSLGYASVERLPSSIELFMNGPHMATGRFEVGDPNLNSETSNNFDITFNFDNGDFYAFASFYITDVDNYIALIDEEEDHMDEDEHHEDEDEHHEDEDEHHEDEHDDHGHGNLIHANYMQEDAEFDGYEIEFGKSFDLGSGELALSFGRDVVNAEFADGHNVPRINPARNIYSLVYTQDDLLFKLMLKDVEKQNDFGEGETATDSYQMLNTRLTKTFNAIGNGELKVSLFANNLLDEVARNHSSFVKDEVPLPGRNYGLKFNLTF